LKTEEFENGALRFSVDGKHFENGTFQKRLRHDNQVICLPSLPQTQIQNGCRNGDCYAHAHGCNQAFLPPAQCGRGLNSFVNQNQDHLSMIISPNSILEL